MSQIGGKVFFLDRNDINTDEIIPAKYLTEVEKKVMAPFLMEDLKMEGFDPKSPQLKTSKVLITRSNFGCGSSREHAVWVFTENGYQVIIAESYARIFKQNSYNNGLLVIELDKKTIDRLFEIGKKDENMEVFADIDSEKMEVKSKIDSFSLNFTISPFYKSVVKEGGWISYADKTY
ncbi:MAG TPA: 3-isopropylmalate dehydratase small subunit [Spirochaetia bacterium]|nr:MAG: 3-isopropylmalate dehydratase [Spirochaetes bacterium GWB1_36_13]HCL56003.1 3-isopropylmalate dehydratase small subunit [Spirochaetia bacterium]